MSTNDVHGTRLFFWRSEPDGAVVLNMSVDVVFAHHDFDCVWVVRVVGVSDERYGCTWLAVVAHDLAAAFFAGTSALHCIECGDDIPAARRIDPGRDPVC
jgi:hypothetical protein